MSWSDRIKNFMTGESPEQKMARQAREKAEQEAYEQSLIEANIREAAIRTEETKLEIALLGDKTKVDMAKNGADLSTSATAALIDRMGASMATKLDASRDAIILRRVEDPVKKAELQRIGLQSAEVYWARLLKETTISFTAARLGNQRLREIRDQLNPPKSNNPKS